MNLEELYKLSWELSVNIQTMQTQLNKTNQQIFEIRNAEALAEQEKTKQEDKK